MKKFYLHLVLYISFFTYVSDNQTERQALNDGVEAKLLQLQEQEHDLIFAIRNLTISDLSSRCHLVDTGNNFIVGTRVAIQAINSAISTVEDDGLREPAAKFAGELADLNNNLQHHLHGSSEKLKEGIVAMVQGVLRLAGSVVQVGKEYPNFGYQIRNGIYLCAYTTRKLTYFARFFNLTNKELESQVDVAHQSLISALQTIKSDKNPIIQDELVHLIESLERRVELTVAEVENWLHINKDPEITKVVINILHDVVENYKRINPRVDSSQAVPYTKNHFESIYGTLTKHFKRLCSVKLAENPGCGNYLRSAIIGSITVSNLLSEEVRSITSQLLASE